MRAEAAELAKKHWAVIQVSAHTHVVSQLALGVGVGRGAMPAVAYMSLHDFACHMAP